MQTYSSTLRARMIEKMLAPNAKPVADLAKESGISDSTLYSWKARASTYGGMNAPNKSRRPDDWTLDEKIHALAEASALTNEELGVFLRRKGLHEADLRRWRKQIEEAFSKGTSAAAKARGNSAEARRIRELERELRRKEKALAEAAALLVLKKKAQAIWGDEDDDTTKGRGK